MAFQASAGKSDNPGGERGPGEAPGRDPACSRLRAVLLRLWPRGGRRPDQGPERGRGRGRRRRQVWGPGRPGAQGIFRCLWPSPRAGAAAGAGWTLRAPGPGHARLPSCQLIRHRRRLQAARARARGTAVENPAVLPDAENPGGPATAHRPRTRPSFLATGTFGSPAPPPLRLRVLSVEEQADPAESLRGGVLGSVVPPSPGAWVAPSGCFHFRLLDAPQGTSDGKPQPYEDQMGP